MSNYDRRSVEGQRPGIASRNVDEEIDAPPRASNSTPRSIGNEEDPRSFLRQQGGDNHRDYFASSGREGPSPILRAQTFSHPSPEPHVAREPGAIRRHSMYQQRPLSRRVSVPNFLNLYGSLAWEDPTDSEDSGSSVEDDDDAERQRTTPSEGEDGETRPLLGRRKSSRAANKGDGTVTKTFFLLMKSFVGTGVLFLPKAFKNGGLLFSSIALVSVSLISCLSFHLLLECRLRYGGGYGDIGAAIGGKKTRAIILASITISQIGFVCASIIFTAENLNSFLEAVLHASAPLSTKALIGIQLIILIPLAFVRKMSKLGSAALLADLFILLGLGYIYYFDISTIAKEGMNKTVQLFNPRDYTLCIGSAIFAFEGIGLILPIQSSMREPKKFEKLLLIVMLIITIIFATVAALSYATFGVNTKVEIISNFPQDSKLVNAVQFLYSLAVLVGLPVQLFPAMRIVEGSLFGHRSGKRDSLTKWKKNAFRTVIVCACGVISALGAADLDKFVALIGSFACVPLVYIYPAYLHWKGIAENKYAKAGDILFMAVGLVAMIYTTAVTISRWSES